MKHFKHVFGALMRDMLFLHGHFVTFQGLDGAARRDPRPLSRQARATPAAAARPPQAATTDEGACCVP